MKFTSHLWVLLIVALVHVGIYMAIVNAHEESLRETQVSQAYSGYMLAANRYSK